jgi:hypothetical protein
LREGFQVNDWKILTFAEDWTRNSSPRNQIGLLLFLWRSFLSLFFPIRTSL